MSAVDRDLEIAPTVHGLAAVYVPRHLERWQQAEARVRLGIRRPADLEYLARRQRAARRTPAATTTTRSSR
jgi:3-deoxy-D-manno-octulosonic-acid transferase